MTTFSQLYECSFRGVPFLAPREQAVRGIKTVIHEYLNSNERYIEELGKKPSIFSLTCIIYGDDSINSRLRFETALNEGGFGELIHPIYGSLQVKVIGDYQVTSSERRIGEHIFSVEFGISRDNISPEVDYVSNSEISSEVNSNFETLNEVFEGKYIVPTSPYNIQQVAKTANGRIELIILELLDIAKEGKRAIVNNLIKEFRRIQGRIYYLVTNAFDLLNAFDSIYRDFKDIVDTPQELYSAWRRLIAASRSYLPTDTAKRLENKNNIDLINEYNDLTALNFLYEAAVYKDFDTEIDLDSSKKDISDLFYFFFEKQVDNNDKLLQPTENIFIRDSFAKLNNLFIKNFQAKEQNVWKVKEVQERSTNSLITYQYFGTLDNIEVINNLNPDINFAGFNQTINMVSK